ncbi:MAG: hypothetical protein HY881_23580 [Deltaproteobacteria bacterium]|nr:hypothetical protein [Deltaproteobacteria bacterium]
MKIRKEIKQSWMILLIILMSIVGTSGLVAAAVPIEAVDDKTGSITIVTEALPDIKANGQDGPITVSSITPVSITIGLEAGLQTGTFADWWFVASTPLGWYSWVFPTGWTSGITTAIQLPLFGFSGLEMFKSSLPVGDYVFYFGVDTTPDNVLNSPLAYDSVEVHVIQ